MLLLLRWPLDDAASKISSLKVRSKALEKSQRAALWLGGLEAVTYDLRDSEGLVLMTYARESTDCPNGNTDRLHACRHKWQLATTGARKAFNGL